MKLDPLTGSHIRYNEITVSNGINPEHPNLKEEIEKFKKLNAQAEDQFEGKFPVHVFPKPVQEIINATNQALNFPTDFMGASILFVSSVTIGNTYRVKYSTGRQTSAVLYVVLVGRPGTNKTQPLEFALRPIQERDKQSYLEYQRQLSEYELTLKTLSKDDNLPIEPVFSKIIVSDFTPEALAYVHRFHLRGLGAYCDELAGWVKNFNRYNSGSAQEFWMSSWNGTPINIDRKKDKPIYIPTPFISVAGTIQPSILKELARNDRSRNGFIDRILFAYPADCEKSPWSEIELDPSFIDLWAMVVDKILNLKQGYDEYGHPEPNTIGFTQEAKRMITEFQKQNTDQVNINQDETIANLLNKYDILVLRFALILEVLHFACGNSDLSAISRQSAEGAIRLAQYFISTAKRVNEVISPNDPLAKHTSQMRTLFNELPITFGTDLGYSIAEGMNINKRTYQRFLKDRDLFDKIKHGQYEKLIF